MIKINYLNHASILIEIEDVRLLIDPWFEGTCFEDGWGLRYQNDQAYEISKQATHLWISHFHSDHFHIPTLKKINAINPNVIVLGNDSYNFQLNKAAARAGFTNIRPIYERKELALNDNVKVRRYPTTGIDNMLLIKSKHGNILNYNDCNLPPLSRKLLSKKIKAIDIFMTNFNHAGKLLVYPKRSNDEIRKKLKNSFCNNYRFFDTKYIFPFASHHYYRAPESMDQNASLLNADELLDIDNRILDINVGSFLTYLKETNVMHVEKKPLVVNELQALVRSENYSYEELQNLSQLYCDKLRQSYGVFTKLLPRFYIEITDLGILVELDVKKGIQKVEKTSLIRPHIRVHSQAVYKWFKNIYGTDSFIVGGHLELVHENKIPVKWQIIFGLLIDNKLDIRSILKMLFKVSGIKFIFNRREEILGILLQRKIHADYHD